MQDYSTLKKINRIISDDSKSATYKLALLRGTIELINENSPFIETSTDKAIIPLGLLIEKWILYYYPLFNSDTEIKQITTKQPAFKKHLSPIIHYYNSKGGLSVFYNDFLINGFDYEINKSVKTALDSIYTTIVTQPMNYIGSSINEKGNIFNVEQQKIKYSSKSKIDKTLVIEKYGTFSIPIEFFEAFRIYGPFINGTDSILKHWTEFSSKVSPQIEKTFITHKLLESPVVERENNESKKIFKLHFTQNNAPLKCVWSGKPIKEDDYHLDHIIPFSLFKNNDLWNLLPVQSKYNREKSNLIPSPELILQQQNHFFRYWDILLAHQPLLFKKQIDLTLLGNRATENWKNEALQQLVNTAQYLINERGYPSWFPESLIK